MLEPLISSRIRRTLVDYLLTHPSDRFYLRGLAKELNLSVSPLRRELKRLEQAGVLKSVQEANVLYYAVDAASPLFNQLKQAVKPAALPTFAQPPVFAAKPPAAGKPSPLRFVWPAAVALVVGFLAAAAVLSLSNRQFIAKLAELSRRRQPVAVVVAPSSSGVMRGQRWQVVPGSMGGGFSHGANDENY